MNENLSPDKIKGMFYGLAVGDTLGIFHEMRLFKPKLEYTGVLYQIDGEVKRRFATSVIPRNTPSDDTRMSIALLKGLSDNQFKYSDKVLLEYLKWAQTEKMMGKNLRALLKGVTTIRGYKNRFAKLTDLEKGNMQSNGSLMRISPMVLITDEKECMEAVAVDTYLTNPNQINCTVNKLYVQILRSILYINATKEEILCVLKDWVSDNGDQDIINDAINDAINGIKRNISKCKGWVIHAFYVSLYGFLHFDTYQDTIDYIIGENENSDTDTNAAIAGAICGAYYGFESMNKEVKTSENIMRISHSNEIKELMSLLL